MLGALLPLLADIVAVVELAIGLSPNMPVQ
jgi:hypothetical protein